MITKRHPCNSGQKHLSGHRWRARRRQRRGYVLVLFIAMVFVIMGFAALVIDIGFARLAQRQMQTAVDAAALEGLRYRDEVPERLIQQMEAAGVHRDDASDPKYARRWLARQMVREMFDDVDPETDDWIRYGAGPTITFDGGIGPAELAAAQTLVPDSVGVWKPDLQLNLNLEKNEQHGDMVAGEYTRTPGREEWDYYVPGFVSQEASDSEPAQAFLVRLRRTNNFFGLDAIPNVSSHGPTIPFMFARATAIGKVPGETYSPREHGMTVRATAIADAKPVLSVGLPNRDVNPPLTGLVANEAMSFSFVLELDYWNNDEWMNKKATVADTGQIQILIEDDGEKHVVEVGRFYDLEQDPELRKLLMPFMPLVIGRVFDPALLPPAAGLSDGRYTGYVPIYTDISGVPRVIGFGSAEAQVATNPTLRTVTITPHKSKIAAENASAIVCYALDVIGDDLRAVLNLNQTLEKPLLAPVSVR